MLAVRADGRRQRRPSAVLAQKRLGGGPRTGVVPDQVRTLLHPGLRKVSRYHAVGVRDELEHLSVSVKQRDPGSWSAERVGRTRFELAHDVADVRQAGHVNGARQKRAHLRLLPRAPQPGRGREANEIERAREQAKERAKLIPHGVQGRERDAECRDGQGQANT